MIFDRNNNEGLNLEAYIRGIIIRDLVNCLISKLLNYSGGRVGIGIKR